MKYNKTIRSFLDLVELEDRVLYSATAVDPALIDPTLTAQDLELGEFEQAESDGVFDAKLEEPIHSLDSELNLDSESNLDAIESELNEFELGLNSQFEEFDSTSGYSAYELVFVDSTVEDYEDLVADLKSQAGDRNFKTFILRHDQDGIAQITEHLEKYDQVESVHIVAHGNDGQVALGNSIFSSDSIDRYQADLVDWSQSLSASADLLFYGCDLAKSSVGEDFLAQISQLTMADVAASSDITGHGFVSGDWELEYSLGHIDTAVAFSSSVQSVWSHSLATIIVTNTNDLVNGDLVASGSDTAIADLLADDGGDGISLREAIIAANQTAGADTILLAAGTYSRTISGDDDRAFLGDLDITDDLTIFGADAHTTVIDAQSLSRVIEVREGANVNIFDVSIKSGQDDDGAGIEVIGAGSSIALQRVRVHENVTLFGVGGSIHSHAGTSVSLTDVAIFSNFSGNDGAGLYIDGDADLNRVTIHENLAFDEGAGIFVTENGNVFMTQTTVSGNQGHEDTIHNRGTLVIENSTIVSNVVSSSNISGIDTAVGTVTIKNSILAENRNADGVLNSRPNRSPTSFGNNIDDNGTALLNHPTDQVVDPNLGPLQDNGGFVQTHKSPFNDQNIGAISVPTGNDNSAPVVVNSIADQTVAENAFFSLKFESAFADSETALGDQLVFSATSNGGPLPSWLNLFSRSGMFYGTPENSDVGTYTIEVTATDSGGESVSQSFQLGVFDTNHAPISVPISNQQVLEDSLYQFDSSAAFSDVDAGDTLVFSASFNGGTLPSWLSIDSNTGVLSGIPENSDVGTFTIEVTATDNAGASASETFQLEVVNTNDAPISTQISNQQVLEDSLYQFDSSAAFADVDAGDTLVFSASFNDGSLPSWLSIDSNTGVLSGTPENSDVGTFTIEVTATDNAGASASESFQLEVLNTNDAPISTQISNQQVLEDSLYQFNASVAFADVDAGDTLVFSVSFNGGSLPSWLSIDSNTGALSGTPENSDVGTFTIEVTATDNGGASASESFQLEVVNTNDAPTSTQISNQQVLEESLYQFDSSAAFSDVDAGDSLVFSASFNGGSLPSWLSIDSNTGVLSGTPENSDVGTFTIEVTATDSGGESVSESFQLEVVNTNDAPISTQISNQQVLEDSLYQFDSSAAFADVDAGDTLVFSASFNDGSLPSWLSIDSNTGVLSGTPENSDVGTFTIEVTATDNAGASVSESFQLEVLNTNDAPTSTPISSQQVLEDSLYQFDSSTAFADVDAGDTLVFSTSFNGGTLPSWLSIDSNTGVLSGIPENSDVGTITIEVIATDNAGESVSESFQLDVVNTNDAPTSTPISNQQVLEDSLYQFDSSAAFADVDAGDTLVFSASFNGGTLPSWLSIDSNTGVLSGTPANSDVGTFAIEVTATDSGGESVSETFQLEVVNTNDAPTSTPISNQQVLEDSLYQFNASAAFADVDAGDTLVFSASFNGGSLPSWLSIDSNTGVLSGTPENSDVGTFTIEVTATDNAGESASESFQLEVVNTNDVPTSTPISNQQVLEDSLYQFNSSAAFADVDAGDTLVFSASFNGGALPSWLSIDSNTGVLSGTPENSDVGTFTIEVTATDNAGASVSESFQLEVVNTNDAPISTQISNQQVLEDSLYQFDSSAAFADVDAGDTLVFSASFNGGTLPSWLSIDSNTGVLSGTPENSDVGTFTIEVIATDNAGESVSESFQLEVVNTNDAPISTQISNQQVLEDSLYQFNASAAFSDVDAGDTFVFSASFNGGTLPSWLSIDSNTGVLSGIPENSDVGTFTIEVTATDNAGASASESFQLEVVNTNDAPTSTPISNQQVLEDSLYQFDSSAAFADVDAGDTFVFSASFNGGTLPSWLSIDSNTGVLSGIPENSDVGTFTIEVTATDSGGESASESFELEVLNTNDAPALLEQSFSVGENAEDGELIQVIDFLDPDLFDSHKFAITSGNQDGIFSIDTDGNLVVIDNSNLDFETTSIYTLSIQIADVAGQVDERTVEVKIIDENDVPVSETESYSTHSGKEVGMDLLANDYDADGDVLQVSIVQQPDNGKVVLAEDGTVTYVSKPGFVGVDTFIYRAFDGTAFGPENTVEISVSSVPTKDIDPTEDPTNTDKESTEDSNSKDSSDGDLSGEKENEISGPSDVLDDIDSTQSDKSANIPLEQIIRTEKEVVFATRQAMHEVHVSSEFTKVQNQFKLIQKVEDASDSTSQITSQILDQYNRTLEFLTNGNGMTEEIAEMNSEIAFSSETIQVMSGTALVTTSAATVGYVCWLVRSGILVASVMSSAPAWKTIDPSALLDCFSDGVKDESLEVMLEKR